MVLIPISLQIPPTKPAGEHLFYKALKRPCKPFCALDRIPLPTPHKPLQGRLWASESIPVWVVYKNRATRNGKTLNRHFWILKTISENGPSEQHKPPTPIDEGGLYRLFVGQPVLNLIKR